MKDNEILAKVERGEGLTVEEIKRYREIVKPQKHRYGKYGMLALRRLEENPALMWSIKNIPAYLHEIDHQAEEMEDAMTAALMEEQSGDYMENLHRITAMQAALQEKILNELINVNVG